MSARASLRPSLISPKPVKRDGAARVEILGLGHVLDHLGVED